MANTGSAWGWLVAVGWSLGALAVGCAPLAFGARVPAVPATLEGARVERGPGADPSAPPPTLQGLLADVLGASATCVGEQHDDPRHHAVQASLLALLVEHSPRRLGLGMEMFQRPFQPVLDDYVTGAIDDARLTEVTQWRQRWGYDFAMYRPLLRLAHDHQVQVIALNAPRELTRRVARGGLDALPSAARAELPELDLNDADHQRFFDAAMGDPVHASAGGAAPHEGRFYVAQVIWDETMASTAVAWLNAEPDHRQMLVLAGNGHCHDSAIVRRMRRRAPGLRTVSLLLRSGSDGRLAEHSRADYVLTLGP